jgi:hypothetical protein
MNSKISARIVAMVTTGMTLRQAVDTVLGAGTYDQIASDVYNTLRGAA